MVSELLNKLKKEDVELLATVARRIWLHRNAVVFGGDLINPAQLVKNAKEVAAEFCSTKHKEKKKKDVRLQNTLSNSGRLLLVGCIKLIRMQQLTSLGK